MADINKLNKFEKAVLLTARANEIGNGAKPKIEGKTVDNAKRTHDYVKIAVEEYAQDKNELEVVKNN